MTVTRASPAASPAVAVTFTAPLRTRRRVPRTQATRGAAAEGAQANFDHRGRVCAGVQRAAAVEEAQVIVAQGHGQPPDNGNLAPMIERMEGHLDETPANATADAWNPEAEAGRAALGTEAGLDGAAAGRSQNGAIRKRNRRTPRRIP